jgi:hypothetical protein
MVMDHILQRASGTSEWEISFGLQLYRTGLFYTQLIILFKVIAYIILFKHLRDYNQRAAIKDLGLPKETLNRRKRKNVISFVGEFISFIVESSLQMILHVAIVYRFGINLIGYHPIIGMFFQAVLIVTFFVASPELRRFYFNHIQ